MLTEERFHVHVRFKHAGIEEVLAVLRSNRADSVHREVLLMKMSTEPSSDLPETDRLLYMCVTRLQACVCMCVHVLLDLHCFGARPTQYSALLL